MEGSGGSMQGTPGEQVVMFSEAVATPVQETNTTNTSGSSMSGVETLIPKGNMGMRYEHHQHQHVTNVDARQMHVEENRVMNVLNADPMVVAQAHHMVADMRNQVIQFAQNAQSQAQSQVSVIEAQAHSALQQVEANASDRVRHTHEVASMQVSQSQEEASRLVQDARSEVVNQQQ